MSVYRVNTYFPKGADKGDKEDELHTASDAATRVRRELLRDAKLVTVMVEDEAAA